MAAFFHLVSSRWNEDLQVPTKKLWRLWECILVPIPLNDPRLRKLLVVSVRYS